VASDISEAGSLDLPPHYTKELQRKFKCFLLTKKMDGQTRQQRRLVAKRRLIAGVIIGRLGIPHLDETIRKFCRTDTEDTLTRAN
jgi:hypothetical protein